MLKLWSRVLILFSFYECSDEEIGKMARESLLFSHDLNRGGTPVLMCLGITDDDLIIVRTFN
jgi:hypothetical protein